MASLSIVIVSYGSADFLPNCLTSLLENLATYPYDWQLAVVENKQTASEATQQAIKPFLSSNSQLLVSSTNRGYGGAANWGWQTLGLADYYIVLNPDMRFLPTWLENFLAGFERNGQIGIVGCKLLAADGNLQHAGGLLHYGTALGEHFGAGQPNDGRWDDSCAVEFVTGAALALRHAVLQELGGFDEIYFPGYYEDVDLCWRANQAGYLVWYEAAAVAYHYEGGTFGRAQTYYEALHANRLRFVLKNFTTNQLLNDFLPAEQARLTGTLAQADRKASFSVYKNMKNFNQKLDSLLQHSQEVKANWLVEEKPFRSALPFVATLRERFNRISTRWYVKPILAQQVEYNAAIARTIEDLTDLVMGSVSTNDLQLRIVTDRLQKLEDRLSRIERLLEQLNQK